MMTTKTLNLLLATALVSFLEVGSIEASTIDTSSWENTKGDVFEQGLQTALQKLWNQAETGNEYANRVLDTKEMSSIDPTNLVKNSVDILKAIKEYNRLVAAIGDVGDGGGGDGGGVNEALRRDFEERYERLNNRLNELTPSVLENNATEEEKREFQNLSNDIEKLELEAKTKNIFIGQFKIEEDEQEAKRQHKSAAIADRQAAKLAEKQRLGELYERLQRAAPSAGDSTLLSILRKDLRWDTEEELKEQSEENNRFVHKFRSNADHRELRATIQAETSPEVLQAFKFAVQRLYDAMNPRGMIQDRFNDVFKDIDVTLDKLAGGRPMVAPEGRAHPLNVQPQDQEALDNFVRLWSVLQKHPKHPLYVQLSRWRQVDPMLNLLMDPNRANATQPAQILRQRLNPSSNTQLERRAYKAALAQSQSNFTSSQWNDFAERLSNVQSAKGPTLTREAMEEDMIKRLNADPVAFEAEIEAESRGAPAPIPVAPAVSPVTQAMIEGVEKELVSLNIDPAQARAAAAAMGPVGATTKNKTAKITAILTSIFGEPAISPDQPLLPGKIDRALKAIVQ